MGTTRLTSSQISTLQALRGDRGGKVHEASLAVLERKGFARGHSITDQGRATLLHAESEIRQREHSAWRVSVGVVGHNPYLRASLPELHEHEILALLSEASTPDVDLLKAELARRSTSGAASGDSCSD